MIPRIRVVTPPLRQTRIGVINFPVTCLGSISVKEIRFKNVSSVQATVTAKVFYSPNEERPVFWLNNAPDCDHMIVHEKKGEYNLIVDVQYRF